MYGSRPWLALYREGLPADLTPDYVDALAMFRAAVARAPDRPAIQYFDATISYGTLDRLSDALASLLARQGFARGDRIALFLQNVPHFVISMLAGWKAGGIVVPINPMNKERELAVLLRDCQPKAIVLHDALHQRVYAKLPADVPHPAILYTASPSDFQTRDDARLFAGETRGDRPTDLLAALSQAEGCAPQEAPTFDAADIAFLVYTSGTTGVPKGAMNTHGNVTFNAQVYRDWIRLPEGGGILGVAPLFHITGLVGHILAAIITAGPLVIAYRFEPGVVLDAAEEHKPHFTVAAITALNALMNHPSATRERFSSVAKVYSGGAPIPPSVAEQFRAKFGTYIHNIYGLTESNSPTHAVPLGREAPVDPNSGALSVGVPVCSAHVWISDEKGRPAPVGEVGEIVSSGPMIVPGYWRRPDATDASMRPDGFRTGDVGFMDEDGWFYLVDRKKDMINAGGYKVWPREVEDVLYTHPAVREAAVVGMPDAYRGETVRAVISLRPGASATPQEVIEYCRERMAAYKYPRQVEIIDELPKTPTGKILRRELRETRS